MRIGFGRQDITPRVGVELCGFGPFRCRHSIGIRERLWARAMAVELEGPPVVVVACDLVGVPLAMTARTRALVRRETGLPEDRLMICCSHTHSGPATGTYNGWGEPDPPYCETLPARIAQAALRAPGDQPRAQPGRHAPGHRPDGHTGPALGHRRRPAPRHSR
jgi:hypothetical protein